MFFWIENGWMWFCIASGAALLIALFLQRFDAALATKVGAMRSFTVIDLEFSSNPKDIPNTINGIFTLPEKQQQRVVQALKRSLYLDFLFMPAIYGAIFLLCMLIADKCGPSSVGRIFFSLFAWLQGVAWLCDIIENLLLLPRVKQGVEPMTLGLHKIYVRVVWTKWAIALIGFVTASMLALYFWVKGDYDRASLPYLIVFVGELAVFLAIGFFWSKKKDQEYTNSKQQ